ncbi:uncharacterized protein LOC125828061 [Solanum verrucosum]|uniref:uncharacterized protein LOC125828061 n=1 Tax=Solanum verrucosum TaxID=315347 RepID=UPI0020D0E241|nr:uncharacterized protein LOC125828061 [Solanum verrucosum]
MDPLKYIFQKPMSIGKLAKWQILLSEFDIVYVTQKDIKEEAPADHLGENPVDQDYKPLMTYFSDEDVLFVGEDILELYDKCGMFFDGGSNYIGVGIRAVLIRKQVNITQSRPRLGSTIPITWRNMKLVQGEWTTKNVKILPHLHYVKELNEELDGKPWYYGIRRLIEAQEYPENATSKHKWTLRRMVNHFFLNGEILYRRTSNLGLLRCVHAAEVTRLLEQIHAGTCGRHMNGFTLAKKILRAGYFWMTTKRDSIRYVQNCHQFQGMDVIGPIEPPASNGHRFILVAINYFKKWVEASTYKVVTKKVVADFVHNNIVRRFGIPESIITDNAANLNNDLMRGTCERFKIVHRNSTVYQPLMNGAVEVANKNIKKILRKIVDNHRQWHEKLTYDLLGYRTTIRTSTRATPYMLVYCSEAVIPAEMEIPSLRIIQEVGLDDAEWIRRRHEQLMLIDEKRMDAVCHGQLYQNRMTKAFNKKVKPRQFTLGQLVLKNIFPHQGEAKGKFAPN